jgi:hypothetical protein
VVWACGVDGGIAYILCGLGCTFIILSLIFGPRDHEDDGLLESVLGLAFGVPDGIVAAARASLFFPIIEVASVRF